MLLIGLFWVCLTGERPVVGLRKKLVLMGVGFVVMCSISVLLAETWFVAEEHRFQEKCASLRSAGFFDTEKPFYSEPRCAPYDSFEMECYYGDCFQIGD